MLPTQLFVIPFFVVGRRMTLTIEIRGRSPSELPYSGDILVFDYDSSRDKSAYIDSTEMFHAAVKALLNALQERKDAGWPLSDKQQRFLTRTGPKLLWMYDVGPGERASMLSVALYALTELGDA